MRLCLVTAAVCLVLALVYSSVLAQPCGGPQGGLGAFLRQITGEWIGICEQTTDGEKAEDKFFHALVKQIDDTTFESCFEYYRVDRKTGQPIRAGGSTVVTTIGPDGEAKSRITGRGIVLVYEKPKNQAHELLEVVRAAGASGLTSEGKGKIRVSGMPFGLGKNGRIANARSAWTLENGELTVHQTFRLGFRALVFTKHFNVVAHYTARRGSDVAGLINNSTRVSAEPSHAAFQ